MGGIPRNIRYIAFLTIIGIISGGIGMLVPLSVAEAALEKATGLFGLLMVLGGVLFYVLRSAELPESDIFTRREREGLLLTLRRIRYRSFHSLLFSFLAGVIFFFAETLEERIDSQYLFVFLIMVATILATLQFNSFHHYMHVQDFKDFVKDREKAAEKRRKLLKEISGD